MNVKEAKKYINELEKADANLQKLSLLPESELEEIAERLEINQPIDQMISFSLGAIRRYIVVLNKRLDAAEFDIT